MLCLWHDTVRRAINASFSDLHGHVCSDGNIIVHLAATHPRYPHNSGCELGISSSCRFSTQGRCMANSIVRYARAEWKIRIEGQNGQPEPDFIFPAVMPYRAAEKSTSSDQHTQQRTSNIKREGCKSSQEPSGILALDSGVIVNQASHQHSENPGANLGRRERHTCDYVRPKRGVSDVRLQLSRLGHSQVAEI